MAKMDGMKMFITSEDNGKTHNTGEIASFSDITALWTGGAVAPAGTLTFTADGDAGAGNNVIDLGAGQRGISAERESSDGNKHPWNLPFVHVSVAGIPADGSVTLYFR